MRIVITLQAFLSKNYWRHTFFKIESAKTFLSAWGACWLLVESVAFYSPEKNAFLREYVWWYFFICVLFTLWRRRPQISTSSKLSGRDIEIEIRVGNIFDISGAYALSTNTTFDTDIDQGLIAEESIQGQFTRKYYQLISHLDHDLETALCDHSFETLSDQRQGKNRRYRIGTIVQLKPNNETIYLIAIADINEHGIAQSTFDNVKICLAEIWEYIGSRGDLQPIAIPLIGSGRARLTQKRDEITKEIIKSFIAACSTKKFCEKLTIVISPSDYNKLDFYELGEFLNYICKYTEFRDHGETGQGISIQ